VAHPTDPGAHETDRGVPHTDPGAHQTDTKKKEKLTRCSFPTDPQITLEIRLDESVAAHIPKAIKDQITSGGGGLVYINPGTPSERNNRTQ